MFSLPKGLVTAPSLTKNVFLRFLPQKPFENSQKKFCKIFETESQSQSVSQEKWPKVMTLTESHDFCDPANESGMVSRSVVGLELRGFLWRVRAE